MSTRPTVTTDLRNNYHLALNKLAVQLNTTEFSQLDPVAFVKKYQIDENALTVLSNMGFLVVDTTRAYPVYKRESGLLHVQPEHLIKWIADYNKEKGIVSEEVKVEPKAKKKGCSSGCVRKSAFQQLLTSPLTVDEGAIESEETSSLKSIADTLKHWSVDPQLEPLPLARPYTAHISAAGIELNMAVATTEDADIISAVLYKLNRAL